MTTLLPSNLDVAKNDIFAVDLSVSTATIDSKNIAMKFDGSEANFYSDKIIYIINLEKNKVTTRIKNANIGPLKYVTYSYDGNLLLAISILRLEENIDDNVNFMTIRIWDTSDYSVELFKYEYLIKEINDMTIFNAQISDDNAIFAVNYDGLAISFYNIKDGVILRTVNVSEKFDPIVNFKFVFTENLNIFDFLTFKYSGAVDHWYNDKIIAKFRYENMFLGNNFLISSNKNHLFLLAEIETGFSVFKLDTITLQISKIYNLNLPIGQLVAILQEDVLVMSLTTGRIVFYEFETLSVIGNNNNTTASDSNNSSSSSSNNNASSSSSSNKKLKNDKDNALINVEMPDKIAYYVLISGVENKMFTMYKEDNDKSLDFYLWDITEQ